MFDFERLHHLIVEHYFKVFRLYTKQDLSQLFIQRWIELLLMYSKLKHFIVFEPTLPVLSHLKPFARAVLVTPNYYTFPHYIPPHTSLFPYCPYRIKFQHTDEFCQNSLEFLHLYLEMTDIRLVGFYQMSYKEQELITELQQKYPGILVYGSNSYPSFKRVVTTSFGSRDLRSPSHGSALRGRVSR